MRRLILLILALLLLLPLFGCSEAARETASPTTEAGRVTAPQREPSETAAEMPTAAAGTETAAVGTSPAETEQVTQTEEVSDVEALLQTMTLEERVAQLFVVTPETLRGGGDAVTRVDETFRACYERIPVGGFLLFGYNLKSPEQTKALLAELGALSRERVGLPVFLCVDEEGGAVARVSGNAAFGLDPVPPMAEVGAAGDPEAARAWGETIGSYLRELGFNVDFAPVADVLTNPENRVVRDRAFGSDAETVIRMAGAFSEGLASAGVLPCWKHFPGHGGTAEDSHKGAAVLHMDLETLLASEELQPFLWAADHGAPMIMTGHIAVPEAAGNDLPASLSPELIGLIRDRYEGLLITDALNMEAAAGRFPPGEAAVRAVQAGNDLLLLGDGSLEDAYEAVLKAVREGTIPEERINESVMRILSAKEDLP